MGNIEENIAFKRKQIEQNITSNFTDSQQEVLLSEDSFSKAVEDGLIIPADLITNIEKAKKNPNLVKITKITKTGKRNSYWMELKDKKKSLERQIKANYQDSQEVKELKEELDGVNKELEKTNEVQKAYDNLFEKAGKHKEFVTVHGKTKTFQRLQEVGKKEEDKKEIADNQKKVKDIGAKLDKISKEVKKYVAIREEARKEGKNVRGYDNTIKSLRKEYSELEKLEEKNTPPPSQFQKGDKVKFQLKPGQYVTGTVDKVGEDSKGKYVRMIHEGKKIYRFPEKVELIDEGEKKLEKPKKDESLQDDISSMTSYLGYKSDQVRRMSVKTRKEIIANNIHAKDVSILPDGSYIKLEDQKAEKSYSFSQTDLGTFLKELKTSGGHLLRKTKTADGKTMVHYREYGSYPTDVKTKTF